MYSLLSSCSRGSVRHLEKPRNEDQTPNEDGTTINTTDLLYSDIYEEGLDKRLEQAHNELIEYYENQGAKIF